MMNNQKKINNRLFVRTVWHLSLLIILSAALFCSSGQSRGKNICPDSAADPLTSTISEKGFFCDDNTLVVKTKGVVLKKYTNKDIETRKENARRNAVLNAQYIIYEYIRELRNDVFMPMYEPPKEFYEGRVLWEKDLGKIVKSGTIVSEKFDDEQNCTVIYSVYKIKFRRWINTRYEFYKDYKD